MTRKTVAHLFSSINGVAENPDRFQFDAFGAEEGELMGRIIGPVTDVVIGRKLWQEWQDFWPNAEAGDPFADFINPVRKHVVSSTLEGELGWNSTLVIGDPVAYVNELRESDGGDISVAGGVETVRSLFTAGVIRRPDPDHPPGRHQRRPPALRRHGAAHPAAAPRLHDHLGRQRHPHLRTAHRLMSAREPGCALHCG